MSKGGYPARRSVPVAPQRGRPHGLSFVAIKPIMGLDPEDCSHDDDLAWCNYDDPGGRGDDVWLE
jgi:hypothetical protein